MPPAARVTDTVVCAADIHNVPGAGPIPFPVIGTINTGSAKVVVYNLAASRKDDTGTHVACAGLNSFRIKEGSAKVAIEDVPAARVGDATVHCEQDPTHLGPSEGSIITGAFVVDFG
jgi:uncharacterized Zn-binding protein involved in type VI secretion